MFLEKGPNQQKFSYWKDTLSWKLKRIMSVVNRQPPASLVMTATVNLTRNHVPKSNSVKINSI